MQWSLPTQAFNAEYPAVFPGVTLFFLPFVWMNTTITKIIVMAIDISVPFFFVYLISKALNYSFTWRFWRPSNESVTTLFLYMLLLFTRPFIHSFMNGQSTSLVVFWTYFSVFSFSGRLLGLAAALKYSVPLLYFPLLLLVKKYKEVAKGILVFAVCVAFPIIFHRDLWNLYRSYALKIHQHFSAVSMDVIAGCQSECPLLLEMGWFRDNSYNIIAKSLLGALLLYGYWKTWKEGRYGLHTLLLTGGVTVMMTYHRIYDGPLLIVPLLMILLCHYKNREWGKMAFPAVLYCYYFIPSRIWLWLCFSIGSLFVDNSWIFFKTSSNEMPIPLDSFSSLILVLFAFTRLWKGREIYFSFPMNKPSVSRPSVKPVS